MTTSELARIFSTRYHGAKTGYRVTSIHLFGIEFSKQLDGQPLKEICLTADVPVSYATEIHKGIRLAEFVTIKK